MVRIVLSIFLAFPLVELYAQIPAMNCLNLLNKEIQVIKTALVPQQINQYEYIISDTLRYSGTFSSVIKDSDSTYKISLQIHDLSKIVYSNCELYARGNFQNQEVTYSTDLIGRIIDLEVNPKIAAIEGWEILGENDSINSFEYGRSVLNLEKPDDPNIPGPHLVLYDPIEDIKYKILIELYWIHLLPSLEISENDFWNSTQPVFLDMDFRVPSKLFLKKENDSYFFEQEINNTALYKDFVSQEDLEIIENTPASEFFVVISSNGRIDYDDQNNMPKSIKATLTTILQDEGFKNTQVHTYSILLSAK